MVTIKDSFNIIVYCNFICKLIDINEVATFIIQIIIKTLLSLKLKNKNYEY
jgi:hypothetical protein